MWLRNYDNLILSFVAAENSSINGGNSTSGDIGTSTASFGDGYLNGKTTNGTTVLFEVVSASSSSYAYFYPGIEWSNNAIVLGSGNTEVTYEDYKLSGNLLASTRTLRSNTLTYNEDTKNWERQVKLVYTNTGNANVTIKEWGIMRRQGGLNTYAQDSYCILLFREVLAEPIVVVPDETVELTFTIEFPMPNHP